MSRERTIDPSRMSTHEFIDTTDLGSSNHATTVFSLARMGLLKGIDCCQIAGELGTLK
jgi:hypothetical protein